MGEGRGRALVHASSFPLDLVERVAWVDGLEDPPSLAALPQCFLQENKTILELTRYYCYHWQHVQDEPCLLASSPFSERMCQWFARISFCILLPRDFSRLKQMESSLAGSDKPLKKDSQHMPTLVSPWNVVWGMTKEIWHVTSQIWVVFLIGWSKFPLGPYQSAVPPRSEYYRIISMEFLQSFLRCYFARKLGGASKCWLFSPASLRKGLLCWHITTTQGTKETGCIKYL